MTGMTVGQALENLKGLTLFGSQAEKEMANKSIATIERALGIRVSIKDEEELRKAKRNYKAIPSYDRQFYRVCKLDGKYGTYHITHILDTIANEQLKLLVNRFQEYEITPRLDYINDVLERLEDRVSYNSRLYFSKENDNDKD